MTTTDKRRVTLFLNASLLKHAKVQAIAQDLSMTALMERALVSYLPKETITKSIKTSEAGSRIKKQ